MTIDPVSLGITLALTAANMALTASRKIEGPRLDSTKFTGGDYGTPLHEMWGKRRLPVPIFWAEDLREVKQQRKTKGGKYNDYTYYGTWAVALAGHEIGGVTRIWFDTHLVYDLTGAGPITPFDFGDNAGNLANHIAIYLGTEDQEADPRMQASVEALRGEGSCPAYRGTPHIVFKDIPVEKLGNRIPQVSVEMVSVAADNFPLEVLDTADDPPFKLRNIAFTPDHSRFMWSTDNNYEIWDLAARAPMITGTFAEAVDDTTAGLGLRPDGSFYAIKDSFSDSDLLLFGVDGASVTNVFDFGGIAETQNDVYALVDGNGFEHWGTRPSSLLNTWFFDGASYYSTERRATAFLVDAYGDVWAFCSKAANGETTAYFSRMVDCGQRGGPDLVTVAGLSNRGSYNDEFTRAYGGAAHYRDATHDQFVFYWGGTLYAADIATGAIVASNSTTAPNSDAIGKQLRWLVPGASSLWVDGTNGATELNLADLTEIRHYSLGASGPWGDVDNSSNSSFVYTPLLHALIAPSSVGDQLQILYLDRIASAALTLGAICADVAAKVGVSASSFTNLDQLVQGWSATQGQASAMLEPLLDAYDSDIRPHGFTVQGLKRTGTSGGTLTTTRFARKGDEPRYQVKLRQAAELPRAVTVTFADVDGDQQPNTARADRPLDATGARGEQAIAMGTWAADADEARGLTDRYFRRLWNERKEVSLSLTAQQLALEPGDVRSLELDGVAESYRLTRLTIRADDVLATEWKYDHPSLALIDGASGAGFDGRDPSVIAVPLISRGFVLDVPYLQDSDAQVAPLIYALAAPYGDGTWPGATLYQAIDGEYSEELVAIPSSSMATWGIVSSALPPANPNLWDRGNALTVTLNVGSLTGTTEAAVNANRMVNLAAIGAPGRWEIVNFTGAVLTAPKTYTLSGFKRGRRGSEWAGELHGVGDQFVLLDAALAAALGLSEVGTDLSFKAITNGRTEAGTFPIAVAPFAGASLKPYAPCHLAAAKDSGSGDWSIAWVRRTRVGGAWSGGASIPLSEASEEYEVDIMDGADVVRTLSGLSSPAAIYPDADQVTDFGSTQSTLTYRVYQISDAVGRGFAAQATA